MILGSSSKISPLIPDNHVRKNHAYDVKLTFKCPNQWMVEASTTTPHVHPDTAIYYAVDPKDDCKPILERPPGFEETKFDLNNWERVKFTLFSMLVSVSILAALDPTTFYMGVVYVIGT